MLTIRDAQLDALGQRSVAQFIDRMAVSIQRDYPEVYQALGPAGAADLVAQVIRWSAERRVVTEGGVAAMLALTVQYGVDFERSPDRAWARTIAAHPTMPEALKVEALIVRLVGRSQGRVVMAPVETE